MSEMPGTIPKTTPAEEPTLGIKRVLLTGATGFVGRHVLRELVHRGYEAVCLVRRRDRLKSVTQELDQTRIAGIEGSLFDKGALKEAANQCDAVIHLVGVIFEKRLAGQTFERVHREGTMNVVEAAADGNIRRLIHMSALGARADAPSRYHRTKFSGEQCVRASGLDWTIFQPSVIHGFDGEFMELMKTFASRLVPPVIPYFGSGENKLQPVSVKDVAHCFVESLRRPETIGQTYQLGGPREYSWKGLFEVCGRLIPGAKRWKPMVSQPVAVAKLVARTVMKTPLVPGNLKFNVDQVLMSQEDSVCDVGPVEQAFGIRMRDFESELARYGELIR